MVKLEDFMKKYGNITVDEQALMEMLGIKDDRYFIPDEDVEYYYVDKVGLVKEKLNEFDTFDVGNFENGEVFSTRREAEEHAKKQRFLLRMKRDFLDNSDEIDWGEDSNQGKYYLVYHSGLDGYLEIGLCYTTKTTNLVTTNKDWLEEYISQHEEEIKKYYFEIGDTTYDKLYY